MSLNVKLIIPKTIFYKGFKSWNNFDISMRISKNFIAIKNNLLGYYLK